MKLPQHLHKILRNKNSQVAALVTHAKYLSKLTEAIQTLLPQPLSAHIHVVNFQQNVLTLSTDSPAWASRMRYSIPELRFKLKSHTAFPGKINEVVIKVSPIKHTTITPIAPSRAIDTTSIFALANQVSDESLKQALLRLATHPEK